MRSSRRPVATGAPRVLFQQRPEHAAQEQRRRLALALREHVAEHADRRAEIHVGTRSRRTQTPTSEPVLARNDDRAEADEQKDQPGEEVLISAKVAVHPSGANPRLAQLDGQGTSTSHLASGKLRALAVVDASRLKPLPDVPAFAELGMPGVVSSTRWGVGTPVKTPEAVQAHLRAATRKSSPTATTW